MLRAGFHVADITPPLGADIPGSLAPRRADGVSDPLKVRAAVLTSDRQALAIVGVDAVSLKTGDVMRARAEATDLSGVPADNIIVAASHTHTGGPSNDVLGTASDEHYREEIVRQIVGAVAEAERRAVPAEVAWASGRAEGLAWNRRWVLTDGSHETHADPARPEVIERAGPSDPEVLVLAAREPKGRLLGLVANFTCHCTLAGGARFSADYPGAWSDQLERLTGAPLVFLNGAMGDVTQVNPLLDQPQRGEQAIRRFARKLAGETLKLLADMQFTGEAPIASACETLGIDFRRPDADQLQRDQETLAEADDGDYSRQVVFARERLALAEYIHRVGREPCEIICARVGDFAMASSPGQMFCRFGLDCKQRSPFEHTAFVSLANGNAGYVPTAEAIEKGGYEPALCRGSKLVPEASERIVDASIRLLEAIT
ncbi:MAG: hypothetical protein U9R79_11160 [Armatimonadota bacterium]|nr:hypothetical protein [Armatimonadota bacterium]